MSAYFICIFGICATVGILGLLSYNEKNSAERAALGIILLYVVLSPIANEFGKLDLDSFDIGSLTEGIDSDLGYSEVTEGAICDGICLAIASEFSLSDEDIIVRIFNFDFEKMRGDTVRVILLGRAALADNKAIKKFVDEMGVGECEIEIRLG